MTQYTPAQLREFAETLEASVSGYPVEDAATALRSLADQLEQANQNAPWLSDAHALCADQGIPPGHISDRLEALRAALASTPVAAELKDMKNWSLLAARALDDCFRVIGAIEPESIEEGEQISELNERVAELFSQALTLHSVLTRKQLEKITPFGRIDLAATPPQAAPVAQLSEPPTIEHAVCTLCASVESPGFYTGCMLKDKACESDWSCDGRGHLARIAPTTPKD